MGSENLRLLRRTTLRGRLQETVSSVTHKVLQSKEMNLDSSHRCNILQKLINQQLIGQIRQIGDNFDQPWAANRQINTA